MVLQPGIEGLDDIRVDLEVDLVENLAGTLSLPSPFTASQDKISTG